MYRYMYMYLKHNLLEKREYKIMIGFPGECDDLPQPVPFRVLKYRYENKEESNQIQLKIRYDEKYGKDWLRASDGSVMLKIYMYVP